MSLTDRFNRQVNYLRLSVTDRCDFRCTYCMAEKMTFVPRHQLLTIEEMSTIGQAFVELGVKKIRITGGEPLIRRNITQLFDNLGQLEGLDELTLTTNASHLKANAQKLANAGVKRINISLDSLNSERFKSLTRTGDLQPVLEGIDAAISAGLRVKLNTVVMKHRNHEDVLPLIAFALDKGLDISFIEEMPLGKIEEHSRAEEFISSEDLRQLISQTHSLLPSIDTASTDGPSRYWGIEGYQSRIGFISPHSDNFCSTCNRVRLSATGKLLLCLGNEHSVDLKAVIRRYPNEMDKLKEAIVDSMSIKPERHHFDLNDEPEIIRFMNTTGG